MLSVSELYLWYVILYCEPVCLHFESLLFNSVGVGVLVRAESSEYVNDRPLFDLPEVRHLLPRPGDDVVPARFNDGVTRLVFVRVIS